MMNLKWIGSLLILAGIVGCKTPDRPNLVEYVNPNIGTVHSRWFFYTPAAEPFGLAKLGASTNGTYGNNQGWEAVGYEDGHTSIDGFPCLHEFQIGGISLMPVTGEVKTNPGKLEEPDKGFRSRFDKKDETARPGYYSVLLKDYQVKTELTATARVGFQRYTFPESENAHILFNIGNRQGESGAVRDAYIKQVDGNTIEGYVITEPEYVKKYQAGASVAMYFYAKLDRAPESVEVFYQDSALMARNEIKGSGAIMCLNYKTKKDEIVNVKIGLSYTSIENAKVNLESEAKDLTFDEAMKATTDKWNESLSRILVSGGTEDSKIKFYTGLYHALLGRGLASDVNGAYPKNDGTIGQIPLTKDGKPEYNHYNTDAVWGAYWNLTSLWALAYPEYYNDFVNSQLLVYKDAGWLGDGIATSKYVSGVGTNMVSITLAGAYNSGIRNFDVETAYQAALKNELGWEGRIEGAGKMDVKQFVERGYVPYENSVHFGTHPEGSSFSVSHTLEYSFSAYAVAQWAKALGRTEDYKRLMELSAGWEKLFDDSLKMIRPSVRAGNFGQVEDVAVSVAAESEGATVVTRELEAREIFRRFLRLQQSEGTDRHFGRVNLRDDVFRRAIDRDLGLAGVADLLGIEEVSERFSAGSILADERAVLELEGRLGARSRGGKSLLDLFVVVNGVLEFLTLERGVGENEFTTGELDAVNRGNRLRRFVVGQNLVARRGERTGRQRERTRIGLAGFGLSNGERLHSGVAGVRESTIVVDREGFNLQVRGRRHGAVSLDGKGLDRGLAAEGGRARLVLSTGNRHRVGDREGTGGVDAAVGSNVDRLSRQSAAVDRRQSAVFADFKGLDHGFAAVEDERRRALKISVTARTSPSIFIKGLAPLIN